MLESGFRTAKVVRKGKGRETKQPKSEIHDDRSQRTGFDEYMRCGNFLRGEASFIFEIVPTKTSVRFFKGRFPLNVTMPY